ncbi:DUF418 domain-containing protein [Cellvibrio sp.]|uniref:DUF418 domain-containing protein n=1 Tax=Cellvibrio sp. TaxID=1965322 RepID=UPI0039647CBA
MNTSPLTHPEAPQRVLLVDALRGFALMGLFLVHSIELFELYWQNPVDSKVHDVIFFLFAGKAYAIFAMLFGISFFIIMDKQAQKGVDFRGRFAWRLLILFGLGTLNSMVYSGEVLQVLAFYGFFLILVYRLPTKWLIATAIFFLLTPNLIYHYWASMNNMPGANDKLLSSVFYEHTGEMWAKGSLLEVLAFNVTTGSLAKWFFFIDGARGAQLFGLFFIGLVLGRLGFLVHPIKFTHIRKTVFVFSILAAIGLFSLQKYLSLPEVKALWPTTGNAKWYVDELVNGYFCVAFMAILVLSFIALYLKPLGQKILGVLAPVGRMSLTIYVSQSLCGVPFFYGYGLGMYDKLSQAQALMIGIAFFTVQVLFAHWWLKRFHYGPLEWVWRAATYLTTNVPFVRR